jgi:hypothetical protein
MINIRKKLVATAVTIAAAAALMTGCASDADRASENLSREAEQFQVNRRIVFFNGITDKYLLSVEGRCSVESSESALGGSLEVTCRIGPDAYKKHFLGLSDNVSYFVEQLDPIDVSVYHYKVIFKPENIVPDVSVQTGKQ